MTATPVVARPPARPALGRVADAIGTPSTSAAAISAR